ncbi:MAG: hypothetical protein A2X48_07140 [Lentisphaerae bacterium GWF2_49_21]|nr:MAG: hypothetical protein A2X48_07140 [Lentisphaerae bacterium GWF2_49_21]
MNIKKGNDHWAIIGSIPNSFMDKDEKPFLMTDDYSLQKQLAYCPTFSSTKLTVAQLTSELRIYCVMGIDEKTKNTVITLPSVNVDQRTALWLLHEQTGARVKIFSNGKMKNCISIYWRD